MLKINKHIKNYIHKDIKQIKSLVGVILYDKYRLQEGCSIQEIYNLSNIYEESPEAVVGLLKGIFDVLVKEEIEEAEDSADVKI